MPSWLRLIPNWVWILAFGYLVLNAVFLLVMRISVIETGKEAFPRDAGNGARTLRLMRRAAQSAYLLGLGLPDALIRLALVALRDRRQET